MKKEKTQAEKERELLIYETADELGFSEKIARAGMGALTSRESGKIGGKVSAKLRRVKP